MNDNILLTTRQILLYLVDGLVTIHQPFDYHGMYKKTFNDYFNWREIDKKRFSDNIHRLKHEGIIKIYHSKNSNVIELSGKGKQKVGLLLAEEFEYQYPKIWDKKWRIVIFDIPERKKRNREILRNKLKEIGFIRLQDSVFVFPFDCNEVIDYLRNLLFIRSNVQYIIAETIDTQTDILRIFLENGIVKQSMIKK